MRIGEIRHRLTFQKPTYARDANEEDIVTYADFIKVWGAIDWESGRRYLEAKQLNAEVQGVVRIRYREGIEPDWRIKFEGRTLQILSIANIRERDVELQFNVREAQD
jgi:SPP1 family predicted phage head-tail adaptor